MKFGFQRRRPLLIAASAAAVTFGGMTLAAGRQQKTALGLDTSLLVTKDEVAALRGQLPNRAPVPTDTPRELPSQPPPKNAIVLFDGTNLNNWRKRGSDAPATWKLEPGGVMVASGGDIMTRRNFRDCRLHVEFNVPSMPQATGQGRGNSGVYLLGAYEVQVLDSWGPAIQPPGRPLGDNECGGIYGVAAPRVNATLPPGVWQTYDIHFEAPRMSADGMTILRKPRLTVFHNGVKIHDQVEVGEPTTASAGAPKNGEGPIMLQDHGNPVRYRNLWLVPR